MATISKAIEQIIEEKPFLQEALSRGIINNAALAEELIPEVEKITKKKVKFSAVNMAIRRLSENLEKTFINKVKFNKDTDLTIKSNLIEITIFKGENVQIHTRKVNDIVNLKKGDFLAITQGLHEVMIITNKKYEKQILKIIPKSDIKKIIKDIGSLTLNIPEESVNNLGVFYTITRALNWDNINIIDIVSTFTEMTFVLVEEDIPKAFKTIKRLIDNNLEWLLYD